MYSDRMKGLDAWITREEDDRGWDKACEEAMDELDSMGLCEIAEEMTSKMFDGVDVFMEERGMSGELSELSVEDGSAVQEYIMDTFGEDLVVSRVEQRLGV